mmetsp:Transcript_30090/g.92051  ORF Transcript_30090/g.92051 Transcript_30090/m.92051 type:complete len:215 (-) Transcript_30090:250-894(-)
MTALMPVNAWKVMIATPTDNALRRASVRTVATHGSTLRLIPRKAEPTPEPESSLALRSASTMAWMESSSSSISRLVALRVSSSLSSWKELSFSSKVTANSGARSLERTVRACALLPFATSQRGDSGSVRSIKSCAMAGSTARPVDKRQDPRPRYWAPPLKADAKSWPTTIIMSYKVTMRPRRNLGAISPMKIGVVMLPQPTATPRKARPRSIDS